MRRNFQSRNNLNLWYITTRQQGSIVTELRSYAIVYSLRFSTVFRVLMPRYTLAATNNSRLAVQYFPVVLNGQNTRSLLGVRFFDLLSLSWLANLCRLGVFFLVLYMCIWLTSTSSVWAYVMFSGMLYAEFLVQAFHDFVVNFGIGFLIFVLYSFVWYPALLIASLVLLNLPFFLFVKGAFYAWIFFFILLLLARWTVQRHFFTRDVSAKSCAGGSLQWVLRGARVLCRYLFVLFIIVYFLIPLFSTVLLLLLVQVFSFVTYFLIQARFYSVGRPGVFFLQNLVSVVNAQNFQLKNITRSLVSLVWWTGWFRQTCGLSYNSFALYKVNCLATIAGFRGADSFLRDVLARSLFLAGVGRRDGYGAAHTGFSVTTVDLAKLQCCQPGWVTESSVFKQFSGLYSLVMATSDVCQTPFVNYLVGALPVTSLAVVSSHHDGLWLSGRDSALRPDGVVGFSCRGLNPGCVSLLSVMVQPMGLSTWCDFFFGNLGVAVQRGAMFSSVSALRVFEHLNGSLVSTRPSTAAGVVGSLGLDDAWVANRRAAQTGFYTQFFRAYLREISPVTTGGVIRGIEWCDSTEVDLGANTTTGGVMTLLLWHQQQQSVGTVVGTFCYGSQPYGTFLDFFAGSGASLWLDIRQITKLHDMFGDYDIFE